MFIVNLIVAAAAAAAGLMVGRNTRNARNPAYRRAGDHRSHPDRPFREQLGRGRLISARSATGRRRPRQRPALRGHCRDHHRLSARAMFRHRLLPVACGGLHAGGGSRTVTHFRTRPAVATVVRPLSPRITRTWRGRPH